MSLKGIAASSGIAFGKVFKYEKKEMVITDKKTENKEEAFGLLKKAIAKSEQELVIIRDETIRRIDEDHGMIFNAHIQILKDPELYSQTVQKIESEHLNPAAAFKAVSEQFAMIFDMMDDAYMKERASDIRDVSERVLAHILGVELVDFKQINEPVIVVAQDLTPSDTAQLDKDLVEGFITNIGGRTSHSAIMARTLEIPAIVGTKTIMDDVNHGDIVILDGLSGIVEINPSKDLIDEYKRKAKSYEDQKRTWAMLKEEATVTACGHHVELAANIGSPKDLEGVMNNGGEGVGLYRTEFLYMDSDDFPTEEKQFEAYKSVLEGLNPKPVVIRTLDIGGDKELKYMDMPHELNPFLGHRAVRLCFEKKEMFKTQLRALLRASNFGNLKIMFPMIATLEDFRQAERILEEAKAELISEGQNVSENLEVGIMVEIPAVALLADQFAKKVDFFSIGTNDLIQYTFAADRMNERVSYLYQPYNPSLLRLIKLVIDAAHSEGKWVGMCGEMAGDEIAIPLLLGLGLDEFSMSASSILPARDIIKGLTKTEMETLASEALMKDTNEAVIKLVKKTLGGK
ncbi:MAG: phosphoenolpyruvate--protein phosphotransferase [Anaeromicrobium sp.]|jgi:phosphotransferase system enzyme I (PtsI)|uniref:phosphoenolpyruvate--protein phosphotransferase n=1 Tax=Anaeromicrobium sp. TaxID=1929132 RepID=UPI0025DEB6CB|nr:phosphoenolpyruvate--protein phosphotransferase [Anaeromicrobium sp.]MCT4594367.1 phosphoenolpyruvate--protein phosphotransferase [Anaeromicrobium sp.]